MGISSDVLSNQSSKQHVLAEFSDEQVYGMVRT